VAKTKRYHAAGCAWRTAACALVFTALTFAAQDADAQCVQIGTDVDCTGSDPDGFTAAMAEDDLTITVQPAA
jgi:hypothetical protein